MNTYNTFYCIQCVWYPGRKIKCYYCSSTVHIVYKYNMYDYIDDYTYNMILEYVYKWKSLIVNGKLTVDFFPYNLYSWVGAISLYQTHTITIQLDFDDE